MVPDAGGEIADTIDLASLLRLRRHWPRRYAADKRDELAPLH